MLKLLNPMRLNSTTVASVPSDSPRLSARLLTYVPALQSTKNVASFSEILFINVKLFI